MLLKDYFYYGAFILPLIIMPLFAYKKNPKLFLLSIIVSIYTFNFLYSNSILLDFIAFSDCSKKESLFNTNRGIVALLLNGEIYSFLYSIFIGLIVWNIFNFRDKVYSFYNFSKTSTFYFIVAFTSLIDIMLGYLKPFCWDTIAFSFLIFPVFLLIGIDKKYFHTKAVSYKTSTITIVILSILLIGSLSLLFYYFMNS